MKLFFGGGVDNKTQTPEREWPHACRFTLHNNFLPRPPTMTARRSARTRAPPAPVTDHVVPAAAPLRWVRVGESERGATPF